MRFYGTLCFTSISNNAGTTEQTIESCIWLWNDNAIGKIMQNGLEYLFVQNPTLQYKTHTQNLWCAVYTNHWIWLIPINVIYIDNTDAT